MEKAAFNIAEMERKAKTIRRNIIEMIGINHPGHVGGSLSCADIVAYLYFEKLNITPENFHSENRNRFVMSKGHSVLTQYAALVELGFFDRSELKKTKTIGGILQGHPERDKTPGIEANTGSLGQGLSIGCGMAYAAKMSKIDNKVYVVLGDSELAEGQVWEAAMSAGNFELDNLVAIVDANGMGSVGFMNERFDVKDIGKKFESFGWDAISINGHDFEEIRNAFDFADGKNKRPKVIIANTVKGKGLDFAERNPSFHNAALTEEQYKLAVEAFAIN
jgi:transketolase